MIGKSLAHVVINRISRYVISESAGGCGLFAGYFLYHYQQPKLLILLYKKEYAGNAGNILEVYIYILYSTITSTVIVSYSHIYAMCVYNTNQLPAPAKSAFLLIYQSSSLRVVFFKPPADLTFMCILLHMVHHVARPGYPGARFHACNCLAIG